LDRFSDQARKFDTTKVAYLENLFSSFLGAAQELPTDTFTGKGGAFSVMLFEAVFVASCAQAYEAGALIQASVVPASVMELAGDSEFTAASTYGTTSTANVNARLSAARRLIRLA
ncbi:MAG: hypothetical protein ACRD1L_14565, partial [Terriglobales bacterium]